jgi:diguanylate cyclase (GGDEF)-like protein
MAIAATPITRGRGLLDLLRQIVLPQERAVELYRRLLAINELSGLMNIAGDIGDLKNALSSHFQEYLPNDTVWLCMRDGSRYQRLHLSGSDVPEADGMSPLDGGMAESVMKSIMPLWIPDVMATRKISKSALPAELLARSIMVLPFSVMGRAAGCLEMRSSHPNRFDEIEYHLGSLVVSHLSASLENVIARQELATANARLRDHDLRLTQLNEQLQQLAHTDESTGLFNKRRLFEQLEMEVARARRYGEIFCCLMIDIDDFKQINDSYGHPAGDEVLRQTGALLRRSLRVTDFVARYGGEEFMVILPRTNSAGAYRVAENLRLAFMSHEFALPATMIRITVSVGVACCTMLDHLDVQQIVLRADNALYRAKRSGKNQACFADETDFINAESGFCQTHETGLTQQAVSH